MVKGRGGKAPKATKNDPVTYALDIAVDASWTEFLNDMSCALHLSSVCQLWLETFGWFFGKQDVKLPLCDQEGFEHLLRRFGARKTNQSKEVYISWSLHYILRLATYTI